MLNVPVYTLRPAREEDIETLYGIHRATMREYVEATYGPWDESFQRTTYWERWRRIQDATATRALSVVVVAGEPAGYVDVEREKGFVSLNNIRVVPEYQRHGLGAALIRSIIADASPLPVELQVLRVNPAQELYARLGFEVVAESETHLRMRYTQPA